MRRLGELEAEIMDRFWRWDRPATVREVVDDINLHRDVAYTTVTTVTTILFHKGHLTRARNGRIWLYKAAETREAYSAALMEDGLEVSEDRPAALVQFVENLDDDEIAALRKALRTVGRRAKQ
ncbi:BlaI/MecI/CopY family transcriptional regulator [Streptomyces sp. P9(2023)]|uniref:BlaI/MecI/CopY family transcriptional regulator n=1 Tax=unclassified Streptomyces TaxID=2593676 RepID=UPI0024B72E4B|nr:MULTISPECIES: BlaI/MecI/CopY family transcriptional regulator [unclassified Streptomyces]MDI9885006.1 BlaI/MecI/CopY family transcriptional regulator [Streptomyces sp. HNM0645]MDT9691872.1 BlaI/MecI/CopY family transcriptional regulator [Streptomyces sp. P9(2023)]